MKICLTQFSEHSELQSRTADLKSKLLRTDVSKLFYHSKHFFRCFRFFRCFFRSTIVLRFFPHKVRDWPSKAIDRPDWFPDCSLDRRRMSNRNRGNICRTNRNLEFCSSNWNRFQISSFEPPTFLKITSFKLKHLKLSGTLQNV